MSELEASESESSELGISTVLGSSCIEGGLVVDAATSRASAPK